MQQFSQIALYIAIIGAAAFFGLIVAIWATRRFGKRLREPADPGVAFTLDDLRRMLAEEKITRSEYEGMRASLIGQIKGAEDPNRPRSATPRDPDGEAADGDESENSGENPK